MIMSKFDSFLLAVVDEISFLLLNISVKYTNLHTQSSLMGYNLNVFEQTHLPLHAAPLNGKTLFLQTTTLLHYAAGSTDCAFTSMHINLKHLLLKGNAFI